MIRRLNSTLAIFLTASRARRTTLMITNSNHVYLFKKWFVDFRKESSFLRQNLAYLANLTPLPKCAGRKGFE